MAPQKYSCEVWFYSRTCRSYRGAGNYQLIFALLDANAAVAIRCIFVKVITTFPIQPFCQPLEVLHSPPLAWSQE